MSEPQLGPSSSGALPAKETKKQLTMREKKILQNVYIHLEKSSPFYPSKMELYKTTSKIMGVSPVLVMNIMKSYHNSEEIPQPKVRPKNRSIIDKLDEDTITAIRKKADKFYNAGELPTVQEVRTAVNSDDSLPTFSYTTMYRLLKKYNFPVSKRSRKGKKKIEEIRQPVGNQEETASETAKSSFVISFICETSDSEDLDV